MVAGYSVGPRNAAQDTKTSGGGWRVVGGGCGRRSGGKRFVTGKVVGSGSERVVLQRHYSYLAVSGKIE